MKTVLLTIVGQAPGQPPRNLIKPVVVAADPGLTRRGLIYAALMKATQQLEQMEAENREHAGQHHHGD